METKLTFDNVDMKTVGKYLAINMSKKEQKSLNIVSCIPTREGEAEGKCRSVTMAYLDSDFNYKKDKKGKSMKVDKWSWKNKRKPNQNQERKMITEMMVIMIQMILKNHVYQFDGKLYLQTSGGGPIGLKLTGS